jgi:hypothetical protein
MAVVSITAAKNAKSGGEKYCTKSAISFAAFDKMISVIKRAWPRKTAAHVAHLTGTSERTVQFWLAGQTRMSIDATVALLRTDAGFEILDAVLGDCRAEWWLVTKAAQDVRRSRKAIKREQERIAQTRAQHELLDNQ